MENPPACTVYLIRHGETDWNAAGRWQGHSDVPLNAAGLQQASRLARRLAEEGVRFDALYSSDLSRAWDTAVAISGALGLRPSAAPALREIDLGMWSGKTHADIAATFPDQWSKLQHSEDFPRGGGETFAAFQARVIVWLDRAAELHPGGRIGVVTHGGWIRAAVLHALGLTWGERDPVPAIGNGSITILGGAAGRWSVAQMNDSPRVRSAGTKEEQPEENEG
jgi:broad specificity phosphatase PhoE